MDEIDIVQEQEQMIRDHALFVTMRILKQSKYEMPLMQNGIRCCVDCKDMILDDRLSVKLGAIRCVPCQARRERDYYEMWGEMP